MKSLRIWASKLRSETLILFRASKDPHTPWLAKAFIVLVVAYALSPIDLIPDFIPVIGYLDDLILIPLGIYLGTKMIPPEILEKYRREMDSPQEKPKLESVGAVLVLSLWILLLATLIYWGKFFL